LNVNTRFHKCARIYVNQTAWDEVEDTTPLLEKLQKPGQENEPPATEGE